MYIKLFKKESPQDGVIIFYSSSDPNDIYINDLLTSKFAQILGDKYSAYNIDHSKRQGNQTAYAIPLGGLGLDPAAIGAEYYHKLPYSIEVKPIAENDSAVQSLRAKLFQAAPQPKAVPVTLSVPLSIGSTTSVSSAPSATQHRRAASLAPESATPTFAEPNTSLPPYQPPHEFSNKKHEQNFFIRGMHWLHRKTWKNLTTPQKWVAGILLGLIFIAALSAITFGTAGLIAPGFVASFFALSSGAAFSLTTCITAIVTGAIAALVFGAVPAMMGITVALTRSRAQGYVSMAIDDPGSNCLSKLGSRSAMHTDPGPSHMGVDYNNERSFWASCGNTFDSCCIPSILNHP